MNKQPKVFDQTIFEGSELILCISNRTDHALSESSCLLAISLTFFLFFIMRFAYFNKDTAIKASLRVLMDRPGI
jgi:hypothetical protein